MAVLSSAGTGLSRSHILRIYIYIIFLFSSVFTEFATTLTVGSNCRGSVERSVSLVLATKP